MDAETASHCLARLRVLQSEHLPYHVTLEEEKHSVLSMVVEVLNNPDKFLSASEGDAVKKEKNLRKAFHVYSKVVPRKLIIDTLSTHMDKVIAQSKKPYINSNAEIPIPKELFTAVFVPAVREARLRYVQNETGDALFRTAFALRIYKVRNGKYPNDLSGLVSAKILTSIPEDPFDFPGAPLHYQLLPTGKYILYSIGPDGSDDGGKGIERKSAKGKTIRTVELGSKGDMVVGWHWY